MQGPVVTQRTSHRLPDAPRAGKLPNVVRVADAAILLVYTKCVGGGTVAWDAANREHLGRGHPERNITLSEIEEAMNDPDRDD